MLRRYTCKTVANMLPLHVGDDLDPRHVDGVDRHLSSCLPCFREFRELVGVRGRLQVLADEPLPAGILDGFADEVMARVAVGEPGPAAEAPRPGPRVFVLPRIAAAAAMLLVALAGWRIFADEGMSLSRSLDQGSALSGAVSLPGNGLAQRAAAVTGGAQPDRVPPSVYDDPAGGWPDAGTPVGDSPHALIDPEACSPSTIDMQVMQRGGPAMRVLIFQGRGLAPGGLQPDDAARQPRQRRDDG